jgi:hypothetical protein
VYGWVRGVWKLQGYERGLRHGTWYLWRYSARNECADGCTEPPLGFDSFLHTARLLQWPAFQHIKLHNIKSPIPSIHIPLLSDSHLLTNYLIRLSPPTLRIIHRQPTPPLHAILTRLHPPIIRKQTVLRTHTRIRTNPHIRIIRLQLPPRLLRFTHTDKTAQIDLLGLSN